MKLKEAIKHPAFIGGTIAITNDYFFSNFSQEVMYAIYPAAIQTIAFYFLAVGLLQEIKSLARDKETQ